MEDMLEQANEVQEALGRQYGMPELDDADLDAGRLSDIYKEFNTRVKYISSTLYCMRVILHAKS